MKHNRKNRIKRSGIDRLGFFTLSRSTFFFGMFALGLVGLLATEQLGFAAVLAGLVYIISCVAEVIPPLA